MEAGEGAERGRGSEPLSAALLPDVGLRPRQKGGLDSAGHEQGREAWPAGQAGMSRAAWPGPSRGAEGPGGVRPVPRGALCGGGCAGSAGPAGSQGAGGTGG